MTTKNWDPDFEDYMSFIKNHRNYEGMPEPTKSNGGIRWVVTGNSKIGEKRREWWRSKAEENDISTNGHWLSKTAREIHPTGDKPCQICGKELSLHYVYPNKTTIKQLNKIEDLEVSFEADEFLEITDIIDIVFENVNNARTELRSIFGIPEDKSSIEEFKGYVVNNCGKNGSGKLKLSPGVMSNAPDRFDGFHTYNKCCRKKEDTGRHKENMQRYGQDRRAYENWAEGDFKAANRFMRKISGSNGDCVICGDETSIVPDHIGPISLGFKHRPRFQPMCESCNAAKNNRMYAQDVQKLVDEEDVISFHAEPIWTKMKTSVSDDKEAKQLSKAMRINQHHFLELFYEIFDEGNIMFLTNYLNPQYAFYKIKDFELSEDDNYKASEVIKEKGNSKNYWNNAARYLAISFESLEEYHIKSNRKWTLEESKNFSFRERVEEINQVLNRANNESEISEIVKNNIGDERDSEKLKKVIKRMRKRDVTNEEKKAMNKVEEFFEDLSVILSGRY